MSPRRPVIVLSLVSMLAVLVAPSATASGDRSVRPAPAAAKVPGIRFGSPSVVDTVHTYGEPDIKVAPNGFVYDSGPWGTGTQRSLWEQSTDRGRTFHPLHDTPIASPNDSDTKITGPGGGDTEISIDHTNKVYYADLAALVQLKVATWQRKTKTMKVDVLHNPRQSANGIDRQWFALWDPSNPAKARAATGYKGPLPVNYLLFAAGTTGADCPDPGGSCETAQYSTDGTTYSDITTTLSIDSDGPAVVDQRTGTVLEAIATKGGNVAVGVYTRGKDPKDPGLTQAKSYVIANLPSADMTVGALFPVIAIDRARNAYVAWVTRDNGVTAAKEPKAWQIYYSHASAASGWTKWSAPRRLSHKPSNQNIMPWITAGTRGRIAVVWYGTDDRTHDVSQTDVHQRWNVYVSVVTRANTSNPHARQMRVTRHPMHYGTICLQGTGCSAQNPPGNRNLADFFEVTTDLRDGAMVITYDDTSNELKQHDPSGSGTPPEQAAHRGAPVVTAVRQVRGVGLYGRLVHGPRPIRKKLSDLRGDAHFDPIYKTKMSYKQYDVRGESVTFGEKNLTFRLKVQTLKYPQRAMDSTGASAIQYVMRWSGAKRKGESGLYNPLLYVSAEFQGNGAPAFFAGQAKSIELCSVSGCFPHIIEYPEPPYGGTTVKGRVVITKGAKPDRLVITVPRKLLLNPTLHSLLQSLGSYSFARNKPASLPTTNSEGEGGITPVMVDGVCCVDLRLNRR